MPKHRQEEPHECQYCGRRGHVEEDCFKKSAKEAKVLSATDVQSKDTYGRNARPMKKFATSCQELFQILA